MILGSGIDYDLSFDGSVEIWTLTISNGWSATGTFVPTASVPEPSSLLPLAAALIGFGWFVRRRKDVC
jgi:hypothetical protein